MQKKKKMINKEAVKSAIIPTTLAFICAFVLRCFLPADLTIILSTVLLTVFFLLIYAVSSVIQKVTKWKITVPGALSLCLSVFIIASLWAMHWLPAASFPRQAVTLIPDVNEASMNNGGHIYLVNVNVNGKDTPIWSIDVQYRRDSGWSYIAEWDDYKLTECNSRSADDSLTLYFGNADEVTLYFSRSAYGGDFLIQTDHGTQRVSSYTTNDDEVGAMPVAVPRGTVSVLYEIGTDALLALPLWIVLYVLLLTLWNQKPEQAVARRVISENGKIQLQTGWLIACALFSLLIALGLTLGREYSYWPKRDLTLPTMKGWAVFVILWLSGTAVCYIGLPFLDRVHHEPRKKAAAPGLKTYLILFTVFVLAWIPIFLCAYPAVVSVDSMDSIHQVVGAEPLNNHHPILFTLYLKLFFALSDILHISNTEGLGIAAFVQLLSLAALCAYAVFILMKQRCRRIVSVILTLYYALCPMFGLYSVTIWKDIFFGISLTVFSVQCFEIARDKQESNKFRQILIYCLTGIWISFARNNGIYVFLAASVLMAILMGKRLYRYYLAIFACAMAVLLIQGPGYKAMGIIKSGFEESVGVPIQQIGYAAVHEELSEEEKEQIEPFIPFETMRSVYQMPTSKYIKFNAEFDAEYLNEHKAEFLKLWFSMLPKYPLSFFKAFLGVTDAYWNLTRTGLDTPVYIGSSTSDYIYENVPYPSTDLFQELFHYPLYEKLFKEGGYKELFKSLLPISWAVALAFWGVLIVIYKKNYKQLLPAAPLIFLWGTIMIASPTAYEHRYLFALYLAAPLLLFLEINEKAEAVEKA